MHYQDGTPAQHGDIVRGKGYNLPHEIIGPVVGLVAGVNSCNIRIAVVKCTRHFQPAPGENTGGLHTSGLVFRNNGDEPTFTIEPSIEYGACHEFTLVHRPRT